MERPGDIGPNALRSVPNEGRKLDADPYRKLTLGEALTNALTPEESAQYEAVLLARSLAVLRVAINAFNEVSTPKKASQLNMSLADMIIDDEPLSLNVHDLPSDVRVVVRRGMDGKTSMRFVDVPAA